MDSDSNQDECYLIEIFPLTQIFDSLATNYQRMIDVLRISYIESLQMTFGHELGAPLRSCIQMVRQTASKMQKLK